MKTTVALWGLAAVVAWVGVVSTLLADRWTMAAFLGVLLSIILGGLGWYVGRELLWRRFLRDLGEAGWAQNRKP